MNIVPYLKWFHNWIGFIISLTMLIALSTGVYLGSVEVLKRINNYGQSYSPLTLEQKAHTIDTIFKQYPDLTTIKFPTPAMPYIQGSTRGKTIVFDDQLNQLTLYQTSDIPMYKPIFWLHRNFLLGDIGKYINAWAALTSGIIILVGFYLWWRIRKGFRLTQSIPKNFHSSSLLKSHINLGVFISIPLFMLCITGFLITYKNLWVNNLAILHQTEINYPKSQANNWLNQLTTAQNLWPESVLIAISKSSIKKDNPENFSYSIRFNHQQDVWLNEADRITMNYQTGLIESTIKHSDRSFLGKMSAFIRPLHDGLFMPLSYVIFITLVSSIAVIILIFSTITFFRKLLVSWLKKQNARNNELAPKS